MSLSANIRMLRKSLGLTQSEFAERVNKTLRTVQIWEAGTGLPNRNNINEIARIFDVNVQWLKTGEGAVFNSDTLQDDARLVLNTSLLYEIITAVGTMLRRKNKTLTPAEEAALIVDIYKTCIISPESKAVTEEKVSRALSLLHIP